ncbi:hypothetical protein MBAV_000907 [Candidatus Magnetobacterium bavaricum]|uniref:Uncharacterized protein n=1 Tax=Candidatus Magnetobacterium bavaricum TaxID=29290 RepID=A0A0F3GYC2_9BACT|nr:hypothetical protein MBAV_000907 [Candidatus Magnetobacterium bavaricum]
MTICSFLAIARPPERYYTATIFPPRPYNRVKLLANNGDRSKTGLSIFEGRHMNRFSTVKHQPRIPKIEAMFIEVLLPFRFIPLKHNIL